MKVFTDLSIKQRASIQNYRINTTLLVENDLLDNILPTNRLTDYPVELPPIMPNLENTDDLSKALVYTNSGDLGRLERFYFQTYINRGSVHFSKHNNEFSRMFIKFNRDPKWHILTNDKPEFTISGNDGLGTAWIVQLVAMGDLQIPLAPSLTLVIETDGQERIRQSLLSIISTLQVNATVALINQLYSEFNELVIRIETGNEDLQFSLILSYH